MSSRFQAARTAGRRSGLIAAALLVAACTAAANPTPAGPTPTAGPPTPAPTLGTFTVSSSSFGNEDDMPAKYTCRGEGISPQLSWQGAPSKTAAMVLIMEDYSADIVHWIVVDLPGGATGSLPEGFSRAGDGRLQVKNYIPPCPFPAHRDMYHFGFYALSAKLDLTGATTKAEVETAMDGKVLAMGSFAGYYALPDE